MRALSKMTFKQSAVTAAFICTLFYGILSCKNRSTSEIKNNSYRFDLYPLASIEMSTSVFDLFGSFPFEFSEHINKPMQEMKTLLTGISSTSVNSKISTTPNFQNIEFNLISVINNKTTLEVFKKSWFTQQQIKFLNSDIHTNVGAVTDFYFNKNGFSVNTPNRISSNSSTNYQGKQIPVVKQYTEKTYNDNAQNIENQIQDTIWNVYQTELRKKIDPILKTLNDAWYQYIIHPIFYDKNTLKIFEDFRFHTSASKFIFMFTDKFNVREPQEIRLNKPSIQLNVHPIMFQNFVNNHIQNRFYSYADLEQIISRLPFMNLFKSENNTTKDAISGKTGIHFTGSPAIEFQVQNNVLNIYIQGIFYKDGENTKEMVLKIPYIFHQYQTYGRLEIGSLESASAEKREKTNNLFTEVFSGLRNTAEEISVRTAVRNILPTLPLPSIIPIYKDQTTNIGHGFFGKVARIQNGWLQFAWEFEQNTLMLE